MSEEEDLRRATEAKHILEHPLVLEAFELMEEHLLVQFRASKPSQADVREECHRTLALLDMFKQQLTCVLNTGRIVEGTQQMRVDKEKGNGRESAHQPH